VRLIEGAGLAVTLSEDMIITAIHIISVDGF
jgi:hypothetical protein